MVRLGIIGMGTIGNAHRSQIENRPIDGCELVALCDNDPTALDKCDGDKYKLFSDSKELIRSGEVDAVLIGTPHYFHTTIGIDAFENGLHVLTEKPISVHKADCERLIAAWEKTGRKKVFCAMFQLRTDPATAKMKQLVERGELGEIQRVSYVITTWFRSQAYYDSGGWRATWAGEGGGVLLNQCPHSLDIFQWVCGMPSRVHAHCHISKYHDIEVEDEVSAYLEYPNGATGMFVTCTGELPGVNRFEIAGDRGLLTLEGGKLTFQRNEIPTAEWNRTTKERFKRSPKWDIDVPIPQGKHDHWIITNNFINAIEKGEELIVPAQEGIHSVELGNAMLLSSIKGAPVDMPMDGAEFEAELKKLIANSTFQKSEVKAAEKENFTDSEA